MSEASFVTIDAPVGDGLDTEIEIKRSRFLTRLRRVQTEDSARAVVDQCRRAHHQARHHCSAFRLEPDARIARSSDDGEPAGTAGIPMLSVLTGHGLTDVVAVVTRYFGGIKLGAGGLVRAYGEAVSGAVTKAGTRRVLRCARLLIGVRVAVAGAFESQIRGMSLPTAGAPMVEHVEWDADVSFTVAVPTVDEALFRSFLAAWPGQELGVAALDEGWVDAP
ncbi:MAG: IMPACT family protein [Arachnia sp.]